MVDGSQNKKETYQSWEKKIKKLVPVQTYVRKKRKWINTKETAQWRKNKCNEIKIIIDSSDNINRVEIIKSKKETNQTNTTTEISKNNSNTQEDEDKALFETVASMDRTRCKNVYTKQRKK